MSNDKVKIKKIEVAPKVETVEPVYKSAKQTNPSQKRVYSELAEITTDLYKLLAAPLIKNISIKKDADTDPEANPLDFITAEHCHFFRTKDSDGKVHKRSMPIANHYHLLEYEQDPKGGAPIITGISGPMKLVKKRIKGRLVDVDVPINDYDTHTHEVMYIKSEQVKIRATNTAAAQYMATEAQKGAPVAGVQEK